MDIKIAYKLQFHKHVVNIRSYNWKINKSQTIHLSWCYWHCYKLLSWQLALSLSHYSFCVIFGIVFFTYMHCHCHHDWNFKGWKIQFSKYFLWVILWNWILKAHRNLLLSTFIFNWLYETPKSTHNYYLYLLFHSSTHIWQIDSISIEFQFEE